MDSPAGDNMVMDSAPGAQAQDAPENSGGAAVTENPGASGDGAKAAGGAGQGGAGQGGAGNAGDLPITDWSKVDLGFPEGFAPDAQVMESLGKAAIAAGLTPNQARALAAWNLEAVDRLNEGLRQAGAEALRGAWGDRADMNRQAACGVVARIDRALEKAGRPAGSFGRALAECGGDLRADIVAGLFEVSRWLSEDSLGAAAGADGGAQKEETAFEGLQAAFEAARAGKSGKI